MIKTFTIFFVLLAIGYYVFNYIKDEKGIGFQKVQGNYIVQLKPDYFIDSNLKINKDGTYIFNYCNIIKGNYEIISGVYNFKMLSSEPSDMDCNNDQRNMFSSFRGKFISPQVYRAVSFWLKYLIRITLSST